MGRPQADAISSGSELICPIVDQFEFRFEGARLVGQGFSPDCRKDLKRKKGFSPWGKVFSNWPTTICMEPCGPNGKAPMNHSPRLSRSPDCAGRPEISQW